MVRDKAITKYGKKMAWSGIVEADHYGNVYLGDANEASEAGDQVKAEKLYSKGQYWLDRYNKLTGNG